MPYLQLTDYNDGVLPGTASVGFKTLQNTIYDPPATVRYTSLTEVFDVTQEIEQTLNIGSQSTGAGAGKVTFDGFRFSKPVDANSPLLFLNTCSGTPWKYLDLFFVKSSGGDSPSSVKPYELYRFGLAAISDISRSVSDEGITTETITFEYGGFAVGYAAQKADGAYSPLVLRGWNRVRNTTWDGKATIS